MTKHTRFSLCLCAASLWPLCVAQSAELTGRISLLGAAARAERGDVGYSNADNHSLTADQQGLRLMLEDSQDHAQWSVHLNTVRQHLNGFPATDLHSSDLFRYRKLADDWLDESGTERSTRIGYELDRAVYKRRFDDITLGLGRQPIDWGTGRFWQPLNVFGAFAPTDLDTDYKPGIDAAVIEGYPSAFSSLTAVYALAPEDNAEIENSGAVYYRRQVGQQSELSILAGRIIGNDVIGASFETDWKGMGWRIEGAHYHLDQTDKDAVFWIAGLDYQFANGTLMTAEWYDNSRGAKTEAALAGSLTDNLIAHGLQPQLGRRLFGLAVDKDITPLLHGSYILLISALDDTDSHMPTSLLHQINVIYSLSNESELLLSVLSANGKGLNQRNDPQSEFGHIPASLTLRLRLYF